MSEQPVEDLPAAASEQRRGSADVEGFVDFEATPPETGETFERASEPGVV